MTGAEASPVLSRDEARAVIIDACALADATLDSYIEDLWAAKADDDLMRRLLARFRLEVDAARALLESATEPEWWSVVTADRLDEACRAARIWSEGDPICSELEPLFSSRLRSFSGIDLARIPRRR